MGAATRCFVSELRQAEAEYRLPRMSCLPHREPPMIPSRLPPHDTTSSLIGKADVRYYREVARLGAQVADALAYAHKRGVLHRDIKPPNLILDPLGNIWVTDFGLAKFEEGDDLSQSQDLVGTLRYMAPERFRGVSDRRGDLYALGATLYELLTLRPAFEGKDQLQLIHRIENDPPVPPRQLDRKIPRDLETIVLKALAKDPNDRFASAEELAAELRRFVENRPIRSRPIPYYQQFWRWCKRNPWLAAANVTAATLTTILAIVSTVAALIYRDRNQQAVRDNLQIRRAQNETREQLFEALQAQARAGRFSRQMGQRFDSLDALAKAAGIARDLKLPRERLDRLRDEAIACLALPDLKPTGRVITKPAGVIAHGLRLDHDPLRAAVPRWDDPGPPRRRRPGDRPLPGPGRSRHLGLRLQPRRPLPGDHAFSRRCPDGLGRRPRHSRRERSRSRIVQLAAKFSPDSRRIGVVMRRRARRLRPGDRPAKPALARTGAAESGLSCRRGPDRGPLCRTEKPRLPDSRSGDRPARPVVPAANRRRHKIAWSPDGTTLATSVR